MISPVFDYLEILVACQRMVTIKPGKSTTYLRSKLQLPVRNIKEKKLLNIYMILLLSVLYSSKNFPDTTVISTSHHFWIIFGVNFLFFLLFIWCIETAFFGHLSLPIRSCRPPLWKISGTIPVWRQLKVL